MDKRGGASRAVIFIAGLAIGSIMIPASGQGSTSRHGFYIGGFYSSVANPTFRQAGTTTELPVPQTASAPGFLLGYHYDFGAVGVALQALYLHASYKTFAYTDNPGAFTPNFVQFGDPSLTHYSADLIVQWFPMKSYYLGIYGFLGLGATTESYTVSNAAFMQWNGQTSRTDFDYSYGLGVRVSPVKLISLFGELRLMPGDLTTEYTGYLYSDDTYDYFQNAKSFTNNTTTLVSFGLTLNF